MPWRACVFILHFYTRMRPTIDTDTILHSPKLQQSSTTNNGADLIIQCAILYCMVCTLGGGASRLFFYISMASVNSEAPFNSTNKLIKMKQIFGRLLLPFHQVHQHTLIDRMQTSQSNALLIATTSAYLLYPFPLY